MTPAPVVIAVVGNPRPESRTHGLARALATRLAGALGGTVGDEVDLARFGPRTLDPDDPEVAAAVERVLEADVLVFASPTYKASYSGLLKSFLDRIGRGALRGAPAIPLMLGGAPDHRLAVTVHLTPVLDHIGGLVAGGLFVTESELEGFGALTEGWVADRLPVLGAAIEARRAR